MRKCKQGGKRLMRKERQPEGLLRRRLSLLLSVCMVISMFGGLISFPSFAQYPDPEPEETWEEPREEPREEIKARLMRQIRYEGWDPYSADMSLEEFYALMELFQEGELPLEEEAPAAADPGLDFTQPTPEQPAAVEPEIEGPAVGDPEIEGPSADDPYAVAPDTATPAPVTPAPVSTAPNRAPSAPAPIAGEQDPVIPDAPSYIPREMFLFSGLYAYDTPENEKSLPGMDPATKQPFGPPQEYDNQTDYEPYEVENEDGTTDTMHHYPAGFGSDYTRPPADWPGLKVNERVKSIVIVPHINDNDPSIADDVDVDQSLFLQYDNRYVYQVIAQNNSAAVLGAVLVNGQYIYYYVTSDQQRTQVSTTVLPEGQKFIVEYALREHTIDYKVLKVEQGIGKDDIIGYIGQKLNADWSDSGAGTYTQNGIAELTNEINRENGHGNTWKTEVYGSEQPSQSEKGAYSFTAQAPEGYTLSFYRAVTDTDGNWGPAELYLGSGDDGGRGEYDEVNKGWALGMEPVYDGTDHTTFKVLPNTDKGPETLTTTGTFYNNRLEEDRMVVAVLRQKDAPTFAVAPLQYTLGGVQGRGTLAAADYNWEADYAFNNGGSANNPYPNRPANWPNLGAIDDPSWDWNKSRLGSGKGRLPMTREADGTYSYSFIFQTNSGDSYYLDSLEVNRVGITVPFLPRDVWGNVDEDVGIAGEESGIKAWKTETALPDGAVVKVEYLLAFNNVQRHYRITVTGAKYDVTVTGMNLMQYSSGAPEFSIYQLDGVTGATKQSDLHLAAIQYYHTAGNWFQDDNTTRANVVVNQNGYINYETGDTQHGGANIRFRLAEGYGNPYYLYESARDGAIAGARGDGDLQASVKRVDEDYIAEFRKNNPGNVPPELGSVVRGTQNNVVPYLSNGSDPWMSYEYQPDEKGNYVKTGDGTYTPYETAVKTGTVEAGDRYSRVPIPVTSGGDALYYKTDEGEFAQLTDWSIIQIRSVESSGQNVLYPEMYTRTTGGTYQKINETSLGLVINTTKGSPVFKSEGDQALESRYIYRGYEAGSDGNREQIWHYIRLTGQGKWYGNQYYAQDGNKQNGNTGYKMALLTIVAYPRRYLVRYKPGVIPAYKENGVTVVEEQEVTGMPVYTHNHSHEEIPPTYTGDLIDYVSANCPAFPPNHIHDDSKPHHQFDDNEGLTYDILEQHDIAVSPVQLTDPKQHYKFLGWNLVDKDDNVISKDGEEFLPSSGFDLNDYAGYAIMNDGMGGTDTDIYVLRLMPKWEPIENPYRYKVALNWVDAQGNVQTEVVYADELWDEVLTDFDNEKGDGQKQGLTVKVLSDAVPFQDWIARHPTYALWDEINWAAGDDEKLKETFRETLEKYLSLTQALEDNQADMEAKIDAAIKQMLNTDIAGEVDENGVRKPDERPDYIRLGNYTFGVLQDNGTIPIWLYEANGAMVFHVDVEAEPFVYDEEFYFTVDWVDGKIKPNGNYKAYPEKVYDENGEERERLDSDAWIVRFEDGKIANIVKNDGSAWPTQPVTYFTLKSGEGLIVTAPAGEYKITEAGSKSGGSYMVDVYFQDPEGNTELPEGKEDLWQLPDPSPAEHWLKGSEKRTLSETVPNPSPEGPSGSQVQSIVQFNFGEEDMVDSIRYTNLTSTVSLEELVIGAYENEYFGFELLLRLPEGTQPLISGDGYQYFNFNLYSVAYGKDDDPTANEMPDQLEGWRPDGNLTPLYTGRMQVKKNADGAWSGGPLMIAQNGTFTKWTPASIAGVDTSSGIWLQSGHRLYVVCTVPEQRRDINYSIAETMRHTYQLMGSVNRDGKAEAATLSYQLFINFKRFLPATGGVGDVIFRTSGAMFLLSGLGLAWLNRDLWEKRRRRVYEKTYNGQAAVRPGPGAGHRSGHGRPGRGGGI